MRWSDSHPTFGFPVHDPPRLPCKRFDRRARRGGLARRRWMVLARLSERTEDAETGVDAAPSRKAAGG